MTPRAPAQFRSRPIATWSVCVMLAAAPAMAQQRPLGFWPNGSASTSSEPRTGRFATAPTASQPAGDRRLSLLDPGTRMLVETELRDVTAEEREQWLNLLSSVDPDQVPLLLEARRKAAVGRLRAGDPRTTAAGTRPRPGPPAAPATGPATVRPQPEPGPATTIHRTAHSTGGPPDSAAPLPTTELEHGVGAQAASGSRRTAAEANPLPVPRETPVDGGAGQRRTWIAPLRGRRGEPERSPEPDADAPSAGTHAASLPSPLESLGETRSSAYMNVELQRVMSLLRAEIEEARHAGHAAGEQAQRRRQVQLRLLHLLAEEPQQALQTIPDLNPDEQEFWTQLLWALQNELRMPDRLARVDHWSDTAELLARAERRARQLAPLEVRHACFCYRINSFGNYDLFLQDEFQPGQPVLLYAELQNFRSELTAANMYRTRLRTTVEIFAADESGHIPDGAVPIERRDFPPTEDHCRRARTDYFHSYRLDLPQRLTPGRYILRLGIVDELGSQSVTTELPFAIR